MAKPLFYRSGEQIENGDHVLLHGEAGKVDLVLDGENNPEGWPAEQYRRGIMISEPKTFGSLFLAEAQVGNYQDFEFVSRSHDQ
jgi:hypothetical protein